ncbi:MAG: allantoicase [Frankiales bacterium]|nr:allantoicase [Frankiales bacterium]
MADLAARHLGAGVIAASDDAFGPKELLLSPAPVSFVPGRFDHKGEVVDGWETRRRRKPGYDWAVVRLGVPGVIRTIDVDTTSFAGNAPSTCRVEACGVDGFPPPGELTDWRTIVPRTQLVPDAHNVLVVEDPRRWTHVRLCVEPDGGVGRLRVEGDPVPDPRLIDGLTVDLLGLEIGGRVLSTTDAFYSCPEALIRPDRARTMGEGWETRRRRDGRHDTVVFKLGGGGVPQLVELDTTHFVYNASAQAEVWFCHHPGDPDETQLAWEPLVERVALQPDTRHRFRVDGRAATHVRLDVYPDGGMARVRVMGALTAQGRLAMGLRWFNALPAGQLMDLLSPLSPAVAQLLAAARPLAGVAAGVAVAGEDARPLLDALLLGR